MCGWAAVLSELQWRAPPGWPAHLKTAASANAASMAAPSMAAAITELCILELRQEAAGALMGPSSQRGSFCPFFSKCFEPPFQLAYWG